MADYQTTEFTDEHGNTLRIMSGTKLKAVRIEGGGFFTPFEARQIARVLVQSRVGSEPDFSD